MSEVLLIGDSDAGKSCLLIRFTEDIFSDNYISTIGVDLKIKTINVDGKVVKMQVCDTAGQERFRSIVDSYYKESNGIIIVYDVTDRESFDHVSYWVKEIDRLAISDVCLLLVGNKTDLTEKRTVSTEEGKALANQFGIAFLETSARDNSNVDEMFKKIYHLIKESEISKKDTEICTLKKELEKYKHREEELEREITKLKKSTKNERPNKKDQHHHPLPIFTITEMNSFVEGKRIGRGATSEVIEVFRQEKLAKKVLNREISKRDKSDDDDDDEEEENQELKISIGQLKNLMKECEVLNALDHPNIIKTFGFFIGDSTHEPAILLEYCESNLKKRIKKLSDDKRISAILSLSSAMKKVHEIGIIHRDLKPENILLDSNDNVKLSDFGLCTLIKNDDTKSRTQMVGSLIFMAPELLKGRKDYDEKVDVYAFGVVVFFILTKGKYPDINIIDVGNGKQAEIPSNISKFSRQLIKDCWSFESKDRPSFAEICDRLKGNEQNLI